MDKRCVVIMNVLASWLVPAVLGAQLVPVGDEFQVNTYTNYDQSIGGVSSDGAGNFVVVWYSTHDGGYNRGVFSQRYDSSGAKVGTEFQVNTYTTGSQGYPRPQVGSDGAGNFVVMWNSDNQDGGGRGVFGQRYASSGAAAGTEFQVNTYTTSNQYIGGVDTDGAGNFVVVWGSSTQDGSGRGVFGQRYASSGAAVGTEFQVNTYTTSGQYFPGVDTDSAGNFVVVWHSFQDGDSVGVFGQRYASSGAAVGTEFQVNAYTTSGQAVPQVAGDGAGNFVVVWLSFLQDGDSAGVFGQRYASSGATVGTEFQVNTYTTDSQLLPGVATDSSGNFVVVWRGGSGQDGYGYGVFGQRYASSGAAVGTEFQVNTYTTFSQSSPQVAGDGAGGFVIAWSSQYQDGSFSGNGVFARRFALATPTRTPTRTPTLTPTNTPTSTPTLTPALPPHDSVVLPLKPLTVKIGTGDTAVAKTLKVKVQNADILPAAETPGHTIQLIASDGDCPAGTVVGVDFNKDAPGAQDSILVPGGKKAKAVVSLNITAAGFMTFNHVAPKRCTLQFSVSSPGNSDPVPGNNTVPLELNVVDATDPEGMAVHETFVKSLKPLKILIGAGKTDKVKTSKPASGNADILPAPDADLITVTAADGDCPAATVGVADYNKDMPGQQNTVTVPGGKTASGKLPVTVTAIGVGTTNKKSPTRCTAVVTIAGPGGDTDASNNTTKLVIDVYDKNDF